MATLPCLLNFVTVLIDIDGVCIVKLWKAENGYGYVKNKESADGEEVFWNCEKRTSDKCKAIVPRKLSSEGARPGTQAGHQPPR